MRSWILGGAAAVLAGWTALAWAMHALVLWASAQAGTWTGAAAVAMARLPEAVARWVPADVMAALSLGLELSRPVLDWLGQQSTWLGSAWTALVVVVWLFGALLIAGVGWGAHRWAARTGRPATV